MIAGRWTQSRNRRSKESTDEGQEKRVALDSLSDLRRQDTDQGIPVQVIAGESLSFGPIMPPADDTGG